MKPHALTIEAMGTYASEVHVDFDEAAADGVFLIYGRTGAGKTSLLDAVCFALYGKVPGARGVSALKSDYAVDTATPRATLEFSSQGRRYLVERTPSHESAKKSGVGTTKRNPTASLSVFDGDTAQPTCAKVTEVNAEIERLLGLTAEQFQQVILLPQGAFEEVLRAKSKDKEELLKTLFDTTLFEHAALWLADEARQRELGAAKHRRALEALAREAVMRSRDLELQHGRADSGDADDPRDRAPGATDTFDPGLDDLPDQAGLDRLLQWADVRREGALAAEEATTTEAARCQAAYATATRLLEAFQSRDTARRRLEELTVDRARIEVARSQLSRAREAETVRPDLDAVHTLQARAERAQSTVESSRATSSAALDGVVVNGGALAIDADDLCTSALVQDAQTQIAKRSGELARFVDDLEAAGRLDTKHDEQQRLATELADRSSRHTEQAAAAECARAEVTKRLNGATAARDQLNGLRTAHETAARHSEAAAKLIDARAQLSAVETEFDTAQRRHHELRKIAVRTASDYLDGIASELATTLTANEACPVCGSTDHPAPASRDVDAVTRDDVNAANAAANTADNDASARRNAVSDASAIVATLIVVAGSDADDAGRATERTELARNELERAITAAGQVETLAETCGRLTRDIDAHLEAVNSTKAEEAAASATAQMHNAAAVELREKVSNAVGADHDPATLIADLSRANNSLAELGTSLSDAKTAQAALFQARKQLDQRVEASVFATESEVEAALRPEERQQDLATTVTAYDTEWSEQTARAADSQGMTLPEVRPNVEAEQFAHAAAQDAARSAIAHRTTIVGARNRIAELVDQHRSLGVTAGAAAGEAALYLAVADRCSGKISPKVSLQRWVLSAHLKDICTHANVRLTDMTSGRYRLNVGDSIAPANAQAGLDLTVFDSYSGKERSVSTLSGGETFQASLALALGVADSVEAHSGGIRLEALFIDEGFGTLDGESLDRAMDQLDALREGGRMVGLISHVGALRERIRLGIEVTGSESGSHIRVGEVTAG